MPTTTEWTTVGRKKASKPDTQLPIGKNKTKQNHFILIKSLTSQTRFSSLVLRNAFNKAFIDKGVKGPVVATISKTLGQNIIVTTIDSFSADFLLEKRSI